ncbi:MAG: hypothetical protein ABI700_00725 [Chloroflexota bacterium]
MASDKTTQILLKATVDNASALAGLKQIDSALAAARTKGDQDYAAAVQQANGRMDLFVGIRTAADAAYTSRVSQLSAEQSQQALTTSAIRQQAAGVQDLSSLYAGLAAQERNAANEANAAAAASSKGGLDLGALRQGASRLTSVAAYSGLGGQGVSAVAGTLGLIESFGVAGAAAGIFGIAIKVVGDELAKSAEQAHDYAAEQKSIAELLASGATTKDLQHRIDQLKLEADALNQNSVQLEDFRARIQGAAKLLGAPGVPDEKARALFDEASQGLRDFTQGRITDLAGLRAAEDENDATVKKLTSQSYTLGIAQQSLIVANNNAAAAVDDFKSRFKDAFTDGLPKVVDRITQFFKDAAALRDSTLNSQTDSLFNALTNEGAARDAISKTSDQIAALWTTSGQAATKIQQAESAKILEIRSKAAEALAGKIEQIEASSAETILELKERNSIQIDDLASKGDFAAVQRVLRDQALTIRQQERKDQEAKDQAAKQQREQTDQQVTAAEDAAKQQLATQKEKDEAALRQLALTLNQQKAALANAQSAEALIMHNGQQQRQIQEFDHQNKLIDLAYNGGVAVRSAAANLWTTLADDARQASARQAAIMSLPVSNTLYSGSGSRLIGPSQYLGSSSGSYSPLPPVSGTAALLLGNPVFGNSHAGGLPYVPYDGYRAALHQGERVLTAAQNQAYYPPRGGNRGGAGGGSTVNIYVGDGAEALAGKLANAIRPIIKSEGMQTEVRIVSRLTQAEQRG